ncbi:MAG: tryptophan--tRNA ligase [Kiritimatiellae bacterium]|jgi:tryptophanyl-tRNA synthetase|nr:tryptophan--tRNA ligase [Kiritimatiellia bacterium]MDD2348323.1 tryptophan--tRNA ligase [Kiritimatiellia bacterium]MDD3584658.1 tryptophan--tRNA ligase [Kiritimatiellia bacterium]HHU13772.1 tryptophan--tRNA ligase [Lentisphaerota bacterium]HON46720.1 tryptophan--tRNA ligase [Kiritimatiellia bacterium]
MRILSGIQPSGKLHLGNYFGMMRPALQLQEQGEAYLFIANYHALTSLHDREQLMQGTWDVALDFLACGLDPERTVFFRQSDVPEVHELTWLLSIVTPMGLLERCHSYKDKTARGIAASHGLFAYPVLMAADILLYQSNVVPVGRDQKQHVEVTRDIAIKFNNEFGEVFTIPEPSIPDEVAVVPGLDGQKMSKSYGNTIELFGDIKETKARIMRIVTDSKGLEDPKDPATCNVFALYKLFASDAQRQEMEANYRGGNYGYGHAKKALAAIFEETFEPFRARRAELQANPDYVEEVLRKGAERARAEATKTLDRARDAVGLSSLAGRA